MMIGIAEGEAFCEEEALLRLDRRRAAVGLLIVFMDEAGKEDEVEVAGMRGGRVKEEFLCICWEAFMRSLREVSGGSWTGAFGIGVVEVDDGCGCGAGGGIIESRGF